MTPRPLAFLGESARTEILRVSNESFTEWARRWFPGADLPMQIEILEIHQYAKATNGRNRVCYRLGSEAFPVFAFLDRPVAWALLKTFTGSSKHDSMPHDGVLHLQMILDLLDDWIMQMTSALTRVTARLREWMTEELPAALFEQWSGTLLLEIKMGDTPVSFLVPNGTVKRLSAYAMPASAKSRVPLTRISDAIETQSTWLTVGIAAEQGITVEAMGDLAEGDVILLGRKIGEPWDLLGPNGQRVGRCHLGKSDEHKAVKIIGNRE